MQLGSIVAYFERIYPPQLRPQWPNQKGEYHTLCPWHTDTHVGSFSFSERGYHDFACGASGSLDMLAKHLRIDSGSVPTLTLYPPQKKPVEPSWTRCDPNIEYRPMGPLCRAYAHKRGLTDASIERWQIGDGMVPGSCPHYRMILPIYRYHRLVDLRGRAYEMSDDYPKWMGAKGSHAALDGWNELLESERGKIVVLVEAPLTRRLLMQQDDSIIAVAGTCGAGTWRDEWTEAIVRARPYRVVIWLDNDLAGMPNREAYREGVTKHLQRSPNIPIPVPNGRKRATDFQRAGLVVKYWPWPKGSAYGADPATCLGLTLSE